MLEKLLSDTLAIKGLEENTPCNSFLVNNPQKVTFNSSPTKDTIFGIIPHKLNDKMEQAALGRCSSSIDEEACITLKAGFQDEKTGFALAHILASTTHMDFINDYAKRSKIKTDNECLNLIYFINSLSLQKLDEKADFVMAFEHHLNRFVMAVEIKKLTLYHRVLFVLVPDGNDFTIATMYPTNRLIEQDSNRYTLVYDSRKESHTSKQIIQKKEKKEKSANIAETDQKSVKSGYSKITEMLPETNENKLKEEKIEESDIASLVKKNLVDKGVYYYFRVIKIIPTKEQACIYRKISTLRKTAYNLQDEYSLIKLRFNNITSNIKILDVAIMGHLNKLKDNKILEITDHGTSNISIVKDFDALVLEINQFTIHLDKMTESTRDSLAKYLQRLNLNDITYEDNKDSSKVYKTMSFLNKDKSSTTKIDWIATKNEAYKALLHLSKMEHELSSISLAANHDYQFLKNTNQISADLKKLTDGINEIQDNIKQNTHKNINIIQYKFFFVVTLFLKTATADVLHNHSLVMPYYKLAGDYFKYPQKSKEICQKVDKPDKFDDFMKSFRTFIETYKKEYDDAFHKNRTKNSTLN